MTLQVLSSLRQLAYKNVHKTGFLKTIRIAIVHISNIRGIKSASNRGIKSPTAGHASLRSINHTNSTIDRRRVIRLPYITYEF